MKLSRDCIKHCCPRLQGSESSETQIARAGHRCPRLQDPVMDHNGEEYQLQVFDMQDAFCMSQASPAGEDQLGPSFVFFSQSGEGIADNVDGGQSDSTATMQGSCSLGDDGQGGNKHYTTAGMSGAESESGANNGNIEGTSRAHGVEGGYTASAQSDAQRNGDGGGSSSSLDVDDMVGGLVSGGNTSGVVGGGGGFNGDDEGGFIFQSIVRNYAEQRNLSVTQLLKSIQFDFPVMVQSLEQGAFIALDVMFRDINNNHTGQLAHLYMKTIRM